MRPYSVSRMRQRRREERRLRANAEKHFEECPMKAQAKAYNEARELERELDVDPEGSFFGACYDDDDDTTPATTPATETTEDTATSPKRRKGILRRRRSSQTEVESRKRSSSPSPSKSLLTEAITKSLLEPSAETATKPEAAASAKVSFAPGHATNLETGEDVPANQSGLSKNDWLDKNQSERMRAGYDYMKAVYEGRPIEVVLDGESDSEDSYICTSDEEDSSESYFEEQEEEEEEEGTEFRLGVKGDDGDDAEEDYDERLSSNGTKEDSEDWVSFESDSNSDSDSDSSGDDAEYESEEEEDGPEWEFW
ncbi:hypothetical protein PG985_016094 [Apiospora marii]|uniref:uncharacterized protein n=1 Tax=Apiospora marii TaxID=335849 RepID=UPI00312E01A9